MVSFPAAVIIRAITAQFIGIRKEKRKGKDGERGGWVGGRGGDGGGGGGGSNQSQQETGGFRRIRVLYGVLQLLSRQLFRIASESR